ncbi:hypothetical protein AAY72_12235 [Alishewanella sp. WH16-1]|nr:hypothetical protein AAY72_12235 [Alishewanella sp. WH16-1]
MRENMQTFNQTLDAQQRPELRRVRKTSDMLSQQYSYDDNSNLTAILDSVTPANSVTNMTYDGLGRLKTANGFWGSGSFNYDTVGNITRKTLGTQDIIYNYDTNNRLASISGSLNQSFSYDSRFNVASNGLRTFTFNRANRLASSGTNSYVYDGHGRRIVKNKNGAKTYSLYNSAGVLMSTYESNGYTDYYYLGSQLVAKYADPRTQSDEPGYTGHVEDNDLQLTYMQQRYYDPIIGRFYSNDPVDFQGHMQRGNPTMGFNRYAYANNNPYKYSDPDGQFIQAILGAVIGAGAELVAQTLSGQDINWGKVGVSAAAGAVTGGISSVYKGVFTASASVIEKGAASIVVAGTAATTGGAVSAINSSADGNSTQQINRDAAVGAVLSLAGPGKAAGGAISQKISNTVSAMGKESNALTETLDGVVSGGVTNLINEQVSNDIKEKL